MYIKHIEVVNGIEDEEGIASVKAISITTKFLCIACIIFAIPSVCTFAGESRDAIKMAALEEHEVALSMYGESLTWGQVKQYMERDGHRNMKDQQGRYMNAGVQQYMERLVRLAVSLHLARESKITLTDGEREKYMRTMREALEMNPVWKDRKDAFFARYPLTTDSIFNPSLEDTLLMAKFNDEIASKITVTEDEVAKQKNSMVAGKVAVERFNQMQRETLQKLLSSEASKTDEGFFALAREHSEGRESETGGVLGEFERGFVAKCNGMDDFDVKVGENSAVIETKTAFRVIRVLSSKPPAKEGGDEIIKIAQILFTKYPEQTIGDDKEIRKQLLVEKQMKTLNNIYMQAIPQSRFSCPLFPGGLLSGKAEE